MAFALIANGIVAQISAAEFSVHPSLTWINVTGVTPTPVVGWLFNGTAFTAPSAPAPTQVQLYAAFLASGLVLTSSGTPTLNGTYPIDPDSQADISVESQFVGTFAEFTNGTTSNLAWQLQNNSWVSFPTTAAFMVFAKAAAQLVAAAKLAAAQGQQMPSNVVTVA